MVLLVAVVVVVVVVLEGVVVEVTKLLKSDFVFKER